MSQSDQVSRWIRAWFDSDPLVYPVTLNARHDQVFFQTGEELVARVLRSIQLNQSVVLSGPRGCGKSKCVHLAIERAEQQGVVPPQGWIKTQGNTQIPRDYLSEDGLRFRLDKDGTKENVSPAKQKAPFFKFARRDQKFDEPIRDPITRRVDCLISRSGDPEGKSRPVSRFIVFLDEINRFSDGVLDSLLTVLEERTVILAGDEYRLPVVVCMTMNPPGYDATARKLSPPLAARISRSYRLYTPDLDTLTDVIIRGKLREHEENRFHFAFDILRATAEALDDAMGLLKEGKSAAVALLDKLPADARKTLTALLASLEKCREARKFSIASDLPEFKNLVTSLDLAILSAEDVKRLIHGSDRWTEEEKKIKSVPWRLREYLDQLKQVIELEELFPDVPISLRRKAALVTLCLWGEPNAARADSHDLAHSAEVKFIEECGRAFGAIVRMFKGKGETAANKPGQEYLTPDTLEMLHNLAKVRAGLKPHMKAVGELCHYGPDGRAAADWLLTAIGLAVDRRRLWEIARHGQVPTAFTKAAVSIRDLTDTVVECVGHKIYDRFSASNQPELTSKKEQAVLAAARVILSNPLFDAVVARVIDDSDNSELGEGGILWELCGGSTSPSITHKEVRALRNAFLDSGVTADRHVLAWLRRVASWLKHEGCAVPTSIRICTPDYAKAVTKTTSEDVVIAELVDELNHPNKENSLMRALGWGGDGHTLLLPQNSLMFSVDDLRNGSVLAEKLKAGGDLMSAYIQSRLSALTKTELGAWRTSAEPSYKLLGLIAEDLNLLLKEPLLWDEKRFAGVEVREETRTLLSSRPTGAELLRLNRLLLEDAYANEFSRKQIELAGFTHVRWRALVEKLVDVNDRLQSKAPKLCTELASLWKTHLQGPLRALAIDDLLLKFECARIIGGLDFDRACRRAKPEVVERAAGCLDKLLKTEGDFQKATNDFINEINSMLNAESEFLMVEELLLRLRDGLISQRGKEDENRVILLGWALDALEPRYKELLKDRIGKAVEHFPGDQFWVLCSRCRLTRREGLQLAELILGDCLGFARAVKLPNNSRISRAYSNAVETIRRKRK
jgi:MoxR-like ATPase